MSDIEKIIDEAWKIKDQINKNSDKSIINAINQIIEDIAINLEPAKKLGMKTAWLINDEYWGKKDSDKDFIDLKIKNLSSFLKEINILKVA